LAFERHRQTRSGGFAGMFWFAGWLFTFGLRSAPLVASHLGTGDLALLPWPPTPLIKAPQKVPKALAPRPR